MVRNPLRVSGRCGGEAPGDAHGRQLGLAQLTDRAHSDLHDALLSCIYQDARQAGLTGEARADDGPPVLHVMLGAPKHYLFKLVPGDDSSPSTT